MTTRTRTGARREAIVGVLSQSKRTIVVGMLSMVGLLLSGCIVDSQSMPLPIVTATSLLPTLDTPTPTHVSPTPHPTLTPRASKTPRPTATIEATATATSTATQDRPTPTRAGKPKPTSANPPEQASESTSTQSPDASPTRTPKPSATPLITPIQPTEGRSPILTMGACNTEGRGYRWGPANLATRDGFESNNLMMTEWAPPECWPDATNPDRPTRQLTVAECTIFYYKPLVLVLFPNRPFNGNAYYDDIARLIIHINNYEDEIGLSHSRKVVMGPVSYDGGVIGSPSMVTALGAGVVDLPDIIQKTRDATGFVAASDNVHLIPSTYFFGIVNTVVGKAIGGASGVYTIDPAEIPPYQP